MNDNTLIIMVGLPFSGKTTKAKEVGFPLISPDAVRLAVHGKNYCPEAEGLVWTMVRYLVASLFLSGNNPVILDGTNVRKRRRDQWINKQWNRKFLVSPLAPYECQLRADRVEDTILREQLKEAVNRAAMDYEEVDEFTEGEILDWEHPICGTN